jgi:signal transduction histidine kinase
VVVVIDDGAVEVRRTGTAVGVRLAARLAAFGVEERGLGSVLHEVVDQVALAVAAPVAHVLRAAPGGMRLLAQHGLDHLEPRIVASETFGGGGQPALVIADGRPVLVADVRNGQPWLDLWEGRSLAGMFVPIPNPRGGGVWGCLAVEHDRAGAFDTDDLDVLVALGELLASVVEGRGLLADGRETASRERARRRSSDAGAAVVTAGLGVADVRAAGHAMVTAARDALDWPATALLRWTGSGWIVEAGRGHAGIVDDRRLSNLGVLAAMYESRQSHLGRCELADPVLEESTRARLATPISIGGEVRYALLVETDDPAALGDDVRGDAVAVAARMGLVLERLDLLAAEQDAARQLAEVDRMRANLLTIAGHELRTPLTVVLGYAETLREQALQLTPAQVQRATERLTDRAMHLSELVDRVLLAARLESHGIDVVPRQIRLAELVAAAEWGAEVDLGPGLADGEVRADPVWLDTALGFLVEHCRRAARSSVIVDARTVGDRAAVMVRDDGPGIPGYERERVFRPFDGTGTAGSEVGLGPGLARGLVQAMGGELRLYSAVGYGSTFVVVLPAA